MFNWLASKFRHSKPLPSYRSPVGARIYAVGDVHGCLDQLRATLAAIAREAEDTDETVHLVFLGDLVDRGPGSAGVIAHLNGGGLPGDHAHFLMGNHEEAMLAAWRGESEYDEHWLSYGGRETLLSYGISLEEQHRRGFSVYDAMHQRIPPGDMEFIEGFVDQLRLGDYLFVHAGIRPGTDLAAQTSADLRWIRSGFLDDDTNHGVMVVHGHTVRSEPEFRHNRIGIDTGCYMTGRLTALGLSGERRWLVRS